MIAHNDTSVLAGPTNWLANLATGSLATVIATIAVAAVGLLLLDGRLDWRRGGKTILGCFLIFGAKTMSAAFMHLGETTPQDRRAVETSPIAVMTPAPAANDPWAAAALQSAPQR